MNRIEENITAIQCSIRKRKIRTYHRFEKTTEILTHILFLLAAPCFVDAIPNGFTTKAAVLVKKVLPNAKGYTGARDERSSTESDTLEDSARSVGGLATL
jgi:hypothetical protein